MPLDSLGYISPVGYVETKIVDADGEVLRRAAEIMERDGWMSHLPDGHCSGARPRCMMRSIGAARGETSNYSHEDAQALGFPTFHAAFDWNDAPGRTKAEVIARLRSAAEQGAS